MINVNEFNIFIDFIANKEQSGTAYSVVQLNNAFQAANIDLFRQRYGLPEDYNFGMPLPRQAYELTQKMKDDLRSCKEVVDIVVDDQGEMTLPSDYVHKTAIEYLKITNQPDCVEPLVEDKEVEVIDDNKWSGRKSNSIKKPSFDFPICNFKRDTIEFRPKNLGKVRFSYLRIPNSPKWAYNIVNGVEVYDSINSVDLDWNGILFTDIAKLVLGYLSINLKDGELKAAMDMYKEKGV